MMRKSGQLNSGYALIQTVVFATVAVIMLGAIVGWINVNLRAASEVAAREQSFQIAEAGIEYYRWHLSHAPTDFKDGTATSGPYRHNYYDKDGNLIGYYELSIVPPPTGSTLVTVTSKGTVTLNPNYTRTLQAKLAKPSLAKYAFAVNSDIRFGEGTEVFGEIHSNQGIRFDGLAHNLVTSALDKYNDPDHEGGDEFGVHTHRNAPPTTGVSDSFQSGEASPSSVAIRPDVFMVGRNFPVPEYDFSGLVADFNDLYNLANSGGYYLGRSSYATVIRGRATTVNGLGYNLVLRTDGKFDLYVVKQVYPDCSGSPSWSIYPGGTVLVESGITFPANGVIYLGDNVWVEGQINNSRVTIVAKCQTCNSGGGANIIVNNDLKYTNYDGRDVVGLIAENDFNTGQYSDSNLQIDAALVAMSGRVGRGHYSSYCDGYNPGTLRLYGMIASNQRYGFAFTDGAGYTTRTIIYDGNLLFAPPPSFPLTADNYQVVSWTEL